MENPSSQMEFIKINFISLVHLTPRSGACVLYSSKQFSTCSQVHEFPILHIEEVPTRHKFASSKPCPPNEAYLYAN